MIDKKRERFKDAPWYNKPQYFALIGVGGIGSWTLFLLTRTGLINYITIYDPDRVELINLGGQLFRDTDIGIHKVDAIVDLIREFDKKEGHSILRTRGLFIETEDNTVNVLHGTNIVISAVDNMIARKSIYKSWKETTTTTLLVDGRLLAERFQVYFVTKEPERMAEYEKSLFSDEDVPPEACSYKATSHFAAMIAARIIQGITNFVANEGAEDDIYEVPFLITEDGPWFITEIHNHNIIKNATVSV